MQHINYDIDELFRKAANEYPLKTGSHDWSAVQKKLAEKEVNDEAKPIKKFRQPVQQWTVIALLLLIPLSTAVTGYVFKEYSAVSKNNIKNIGESEKILLSNQYSKNNKIANSTFSSHHSKYTTVISDNACTNNSTLDAPVTESARFDIAAVAPQLQIKKNTSPVITGLLKNAGITDVENTLLKSQDAAAEKNQKKLITIKTSHAQNFYAGFLGIAELTNVKGQQFRKPGFNGGFVLGYNLSNKVQAEIEFIASRKYYYSDGKFAAPNTIRNDELPIGGVKIYSSMAEIPLLLRYNITNNNTNKFFAAAGTVTNIVHREHYNYGYEKDGRQRKGGKIYNESVQNLFSNLQLSVGYEHKLSNCNYLRIEPYYRIPLNGTGVANLPVTSMGINIGFIKYFK